MEYVLTDKDIEYLKKCLYSEKYSGDPNLPEESIMVYSVTYNNGVSNNGVCDCDDGALCEHRLEWLIDYIENKKLKTRKTKLIKLNED